MSLIKHVIDALSQSNILPLRPGSEPKKLPHGAGWVYPVDAEAAEPMTHEGLVTLMRDACSQAGVDQNAIRYTLKFGSDSGVTLKILTA